jgi:SlyX protein
MNDKKIIKLEEKIAYLQNMLDGINMTVFRQQERIEKLSELVNDMNKNINSSKNTRPVEDSIDKDNPPHY